MRIRIGKELILLNLLVVLLIAAIILTPSNILRIILGLPFLLFFPGYTLVAALFTKRDGISGIERIALSFGTSIAVVPLIGLILNSTPWGIRLEPILYSIASFIFITSIAAWLRRKQLPEGQCFAVEFPFRMQSWGGASWDMVLSIILVFAVLGVLGVVGYVIVMPTTGESFSEFYILGVEGNTTEYPGDLVVGEEGKVIVCIINHEYEDISYHVEILIGGVRHNGIGPVVLAHEGKWTQEVVFAPVNVGERQKVEFALHKQGEPYSQLHLWLNVTE